MVTILDLVTGAVLALAALGAFAAWWSHRPAGGARFWLFAGLGLAVLAADKPWRLLDRAHEGLHRLGFADPPLLRGIDDLLLLLGGALAGVLWVMYRHEVAGSRERQWFLATAAALFAAAFAIDAFGPANGVLPRTEQWLEFGSALATAAFAVHAGREGVQRRAGVRASSGGLRVVR